MRITMHVVSDLVLCQHANHLAGFSNSIIYRVHPCFGLNVRIWAQWSWTRFMRAPFGCFHTLSIPCLRPPFHADPGTGSVPHACVLAVYLDVFLTTFVILNCQKRLATKLITFAGLWANAGVDTSTL